MARGNSWRNRQRLLPFGQLEKSRKLGMHWKRPLIWKASSGVLAVEGWTYFSDVRGVSKLTTAQGSIFPGYIRRGYEMLPSIPQHITTTSSKPQNNPRPNMDQLSQRTNMCFHYEYYFIFVNLLAFLSNQPAQPKTKTRPRGIYIIIIRDLNLQKQRPYLIPFNIFGPMRS